MIKLKNWKSLKERCAQYCLKCPKESTPGFIERLINDMFMSLLDYEKELKKLEAENLEDKD